MQAENSTYQNKFFLAVRELGYTKFAITLLISALPLANLFAWESFSIFDTALTHRVWIVSLELIVLGLTLAFIPTSKLITDLSKSPIIFGLVTVFCFWGFLGVSNAENGFASAIRQVEICIHILFIYLLSHFLNRSIQRIVVVAGILFALFYTCFHFFLLRLAVGDAPYDWVSNIPFYTNIRHWGYLQVIALPLCYLGFKSKQELTRIGSYTLFFVASCAIIFSGGRGSLIAILLVIFVIAPLLIKPSYKQFTATVVIFALSIVAATLLEGNNHSLSIKRLFFLTSLVEVDEIDLNKTSSNRLGIYKDAMREVLNEHPLTGMGPDNYRYSLNHEYHVIPTQPHSSIIQFIYEYGIVGFLLLTALAAKLFKNWLLSRSYLSRVCLLALISTIVASIFDGHFYHSFSLLHIVLIISVIVSSTTNSKTLTPGSPYSQKSVSPSPIKKRAIVLTTMTPLVCLWLIHLNTYIQYTQPLTSQNQLDSIRSFPSIIATQLWLTNHYDENLLIEGLKIGFYKSDTQCAHKKLLQLMFQVEVIDKTNKCIPRTLH